MISSSAVIGLGYGDEGKGSVVNYLSKQYPNPLIVRYSGGQQAGHTVVTPTGLKHIFSNFGSGTLSGHPTYWSKYCTIDPIGIIRELNVILSLSDKIRPSLEIDAKCPVTTPYDTLYSQTSDTYQKNGSCGVGVGSTIQREANHYSLTFNDLFYPKILDIKLDLIHKYYISLGIKETNDLNNNIQLFRNCINLITNKSHYIEITWGIPKHINGHNIYEYIFEGSQGLMLDQNIGFFPHVTHSNTGTKNIMKMGFSPQLFLVTRAYDTRHGNGPMTSDETLDIIIDPNETNVKNKHQGMLRRSLLDLDRLKYVTEKDEYIRQSKRFSTLVITCLDHLNEYKYIKDRKVIKLDNEDMFVETIAKYIGIPIKNVIRSNKPYIDK